VNAIDPSRVYCGRSVSPLSMSSSLPTYMKLVDNTLQLNESAIAFQYAFAARRRSGASVSFLDQYPDDDDDALVADSTIIMADDDNYSAIDDEASVNELGKSSYSADMSSECSRHKVCDKLLFSHKCPGPPTCRFEHGKAAISAARQWYLDKLQTDPKIFLELLGLVPNPLLTLQTKAVLLPVGRILDFNLLGRNMVTLPFYQLTTLSLLWMRISRVVVLPLMTVRFEQPFCRM
jgi:hypothetical protein